MKGMVRRVLVTRALDIMKTQALQHRKYPMERIEMMLLDLNFSSY
jgi:hypothetical protein